MNYFEEQIGKKVLEAVVNRKSHACAMPTSIYFRGESDGIILWAIPFHWESAERCLRYCYSDLAGNPLFGEDTFVYATVVHNGYALIREWSGGTKYIINMTTFERTPMDTTDAPYYAEEPWDEIIAIAKRKIPHQEKSFSVRKISDCPTIK